MPCTYFVCYFVYMSFSANLDEHDPWVLGQYDYNHNGLLYPVYDFENADWSYIPVNIRNNEFGLVFQ